MAWQKILAQVGAGALAGAVGTLASELTKNQISNKPPADYRYYTPRDVEEKKPLWENPLVWIAVAGVLIILVAR